MDISPAFTFDDALLMPARSSVVPSEVSTKTSLISGMELNIPILSAAMDTVTECRLAIAIAQAGGLGVIHRNLSIFDQANQVRDVKRYESGMVIDPITILPNTRLSEVLALKEKHQISGFPVVDAAGKLVGILTNRDTRFAGDPAAPASDLMTCEDLAVAEVGVTFEQARDILQRRRLERLVIVDSDFRVVGLITVKDMDKALAFPLATKDDRGRLRVGAASTVGDAGFERSIALVEAGVDVIVIDTAHGHSVHVARAVERLKRERPGVRIMAGNVATYEGARSLVDAGADAVKVGVGPGSICTTRMVAGIGVPQLTAVAEAARACAHSGVTVIADGGIKYSGDIAKAIACGASSVMMGSVFAGVDEAPGEVILYQGRSYKSYRGMGSVSAMALGSADRYFQKDVQDQLKLVPEGIEGQVPCRGPVGPVLYQLVGGLRAAMGYVGASDIPALQRTKDIIGITGAGLREGHVHDVMITRETSNYHLD